MMMMMMMICVCLLGIEGIQPSDMTLLTEVSFSLFKYTTQLLNRHSPILGLKARVL